MFYRLIQTYLPVDIDFLKRRNGMRWDNFDLFGSSTHIVGTNRYIVKATIRDLFVSDIANNVAGDSSSFTIIFFVLSLHDDTSEMGIYYDDITLKFYYVGTSTIIPIANYTLSGFYQQGAGTGTTVERYGFAKTQVISWEEVSKNVSEIVLRSSLVTRVRFEKPGWKSKKHELLVQGDVKVNPFTGKKIEQGGIELCSYTPDGSGGHSGEFMVFTKWFLVFMFATFFCVLCSA